LVITVKKKDNNILPPLSERNSLIRWLRKNLFLTWYDSLLTIFGAGIIFFILKSIIKWLSVARWDVIVVNLQILLVGSYPKDQLWRLWLCLVLLFFISGLSLGGRLKTKKKIFYELTLVPIVFALFPFSFIVRMYFLGLTLALLIGFFLGRCFVQILQKNTVLFLFWLLYIPFALLIIAGLPLNNAFLPIVPSNLWGGLLLTLIIAIISILVSFPIGLFLALGRRSKLPAISIFSTIIIEGIRGVPMITLLFSAYLILPLLLPSYVTLSVLVRAMAAIIIFHGAYMAENIRAGLQAIPKTQYEASYALGFNKFFTMLLIILPQALRTIIPILVNSFTGMIKDTSLVSMVGLLDLVGISTAIGANPDYFGTQKEVLLFISGIYFILCYNLSKASLQMEKSLGAGER